MPDAAVIWLQTGYQRFAELGPEGLKVEPLAKNAGISKSSFYHHFADIACFEEDLCRLHLQQCRLIGEKEKQCCSIQPDLVNVLLQHKTDLLFNRQLRVHRHKALYKTTLQKADALTGEHFVKLWIAELNLPYSMLQLQGMFELALENFYLQLTPDNLTANWLKSYFEKLAQVLKNLRLSH
ncbi:MAG: TetR/AcrR family transcriptional regulator [Chitinophagaceae bacterium]|jgi:AcrR family transcriptional regulator|nr:TetR/AcrR family transcriptional regulator [Chitinophagaceae bacterium]